MEGHILIFKSQTVVIKYYENYLVIISGIMLFIPELPCRVSIICFSVQLSAWDCHDRAPEWVTTVGYINHNIDNPHAHKHANHDLLPVEVSRGPSLNLLLCVRASGVARLKRFPWKSDVMMKCAYNSEILLKRCKFSNDQPLVA